MDKVLFYPDRFEVNYVNIHSELIKQRFGMDLSRFLSMPEDLDRKKLNAP